MSRESDYDWRALDRTPVVQGLWEPEQDALWGEDIDVNPDYL